MTDNKNMKLNDEMMAKARDLATERMTDEAKALGADAIVGVRFASS